MDLRSVVLKWGTDKEDRSAATADKLVVSGGALSGEALEGRPAVLAVPSGEGVVVAFNFNPMHRDLNRSDYRMLWNGILNWRSLRPPN